MEKLNYLSIARRARSKDGINMLKSKLSEDDITELKNAGLKLLHAGETYLLIDEDTYIEQIDIRNVFSLPLVRKEIESYIRLVKTPIIVEKDKRLVFALHEMRTKRLEDLLQELENYYIDVNGLSDYNEKLRKTDRIRIDRKYFFALYEENRSEEKVIPKGEVARFRIFNMIIKEVSNLLRCELLLSVDNKSVTYIREKSNYRTYHHD